MNPPGYGYPQQGAPPPGYPPPQGYGYPQQPPPPQKKGLSGCAIAAIIVGSLALVAFIGVAIVVFFVAKKVRGMAEEGLNAPGSAEIRAAGCDVGMVTDLSKVGAMFGVDAGAAAADGSSVIILCQMTSQKPAPSCKDVAGTYVKAVTPPGQFTVQVSAQGRPQPMCQEIYSQKGVLLPTVR